MDQELVDLLRQVGQHFGVEFEDTLRRLIDEYGDEREQHADAEDVHILVSRSAVIAAIRGLPGVL